MSISRTEQLSRTIVSGALATALTVGKDSEAYYSPSQDQLIAILLHWLSALDQSKSRAENPQAVKLFLDHFQCILDESPLEKKRASARCGSCGGTGSTVCNSCSGRGVSDCSSCRGSGQRGTTKEYDPGVGEYVSIPKTCGACGGSGGVVCRKCGGSPIHVCGRCGGSGVL